MAEKRDYSLTPTGKKKGFNKDGSPRAPRTEKQKEHAKKYMEARRKTYELDIPPGENNAILKHLIEVNDNAIEKGRVSKDDPVEIAERSREYFQMCANNDEKPTVAGYAMSLGISRNLLFKWRTGEIHLPQESLDVIDRYYALLTAHMEQLMENGKINPIPAIFLMKNNMGYKDQQDVNVTAVNPLGEITDNKELEAKYNNVIAEDVDFVDVE